jgi:hypothetical protein
MSKALVKYLARENDIPEELARLILVKRANRRFDSPGAFRKEKILGGNGNGNSNKERKISQGTYSLQN